MNKFRQTPEVLGKYNDIISQQAQDGIIEQVFELEPESQVHYVPHRVAIREDAETAKVRVVYDASCNERKFGVSLKECLHVGPSLAPFMFDVLLKVRSNALALVGDIDKAFLNFELHPPD